MTKRPPETTPRTTRRRLLRQAGAVPLVPLLWSGPASPARAAGTEPPFRRCRPADPSWPAKARWDGLNQQAGGRLVALRSPLADCTDAAHGAACEEVFRRLKNPYYISDEPALTQTSGWADGWTSEPSVYAVAATSADDVAAAVNFARENDLRLVVKGGGHSYQGTSNAADSLLIWTRRMNGIALHDGFVGHGCAGRRDPLPAVTVGAGAIWKHVYDAVTTGAGRYVQGGGCATVGVAGLIQSGGFGSFSKNFGIAAAGLLEAEIVTADGAVRIANACTEPELFWALKGGGGGSLGVVTRLTLATHDLPEVFGAVFGTIRANSDAAFRRLVGRFLGFYGDSLFNPHWGESVRFGRDNTLGVAMVFQGLDQPTAEGVWRPLLDWVAGSPRDFSAVAPLRVASLPARHFWDAAFLRKNAPNLIVADDRPGAPAENVFWAGDQGQVGWFLHGYRSAWLPAGLLQESQQARLAEAIFAGTRHWPVALHFNKGLAGAPAEAVAAARDTATNPAVLDAFALAIVAGGAPPAFPGIPGHEPDLALARGHAENIGKAMAELLTVAPDAGSYVSEGDFFDDGWRQSFWGPNYPRLLATKQKYDPAGLFFVYHGVGSEGWTADGFSRVAGP